MNMSMNDHVSTSCGTCPELSNTRLSKTYLAFGVPRLYLANAMQKLPEAFDIEKRGIVRHEFLKVVCLFS